MYLAKCFGFIALAILLTFAPRAFAYDGETNTYNCAGNVTVVTNDWTSDAIFTVNGERLKVLAAPLQYGDLPTFINRRGQVFAFDRAAESGLALTLQTAGRAKDLDCDLEKRCDGKGICSGPWAAVK